jgi:hypothetical protein
MDGEQVNVEADIKMLVDEGLLQPKEIIKWRAAIGDTR